MMNKRVCKVIGIVFLLLEIAVLPEAVRLMLNQHLAYLPPVSIIALSMTFGSIALCILMSYFSVSESNNYPSYTFLFELMVFVCCIAPVTDLATRVLDSAGRPELNMFINTVFYLVGINVTYFILRYEFLIIGADKKPLLKKIRLAALALTLIDNAATLLNIPFGFFFTINENGAYESAPTFWTAYIAPAVIIAATAVTAVREMRPGRQRRAFLSFWIFALAASVLQIWQEALTVQYAGYSLSLFVIYINVQSELDTVCVTITDKEAS